MNATAKNGDAWTGERDGQWWQYTDPAGNLYESREVPEYRIVMDNATQTTDSRGRLCIVPLDKLAG